jgi:hypothetical protein
MFELANAHFPTQIRKRAAVKDRVNPGIWGHIAVQNQKNAGKVSSPTLSYSCPFKTVRWHYLSAHLKSEDLALISLANEYLGYQSHPLSQARFVGTRVN